MTRLSRSCLYAERGEQSSERDLNEVARRLSSTRSFHPVRPSLISYPRNPNGPATVPLLARYYERVSLTKAAGTKTRRVKSGDPRVFLFDPPNFMRPVFHAPGNIIIIMITFTPYARTPSRADATMAPNLKAWPFIVKSLYPRIASGVSVTIQLRSRCFLLVDARDRLVSQLTASPRSRCDTDREKQLGDCLF